MPWLLRTAGPWHRVILLRLSPAVTRRTVSSGSPVAHSIASVLKRTSEAAAAPEPQSIGVVGHVRTVRNQKRRSFVEIGDGSTSSSLQALLSPEQAAGLQTGTAVKLCGTWERCPPGKEQTHELHVRSVDILGQSDAETYPLQKKYHSPEFLRTIPHLRLRVPFNALVARLRSEFDYQLATFFRNNDYIQVHPPIITSSDCEGAGEVFSVEPKHAPGLGSGEGPKSAGPGEGFFGPPKYLTVSSQLHLEAFIHEHPRVWSSTPAFRAEKSDTPRHLSEFYMAEGELRTRSLDEVMDCVENLIRHVASELQASGIADELQAAVVAQQADGKGASTSKSGAIAHRWRGLRKPYWPRITYSDALRLLESAASSGDADVPQPPAWGAGLQLEHEKFLASEVGQGMPVFVTHYPRAVKPFYMLPSQPDEAGDPQGPTVACFDLLLPEMCEIVGGSLREHRVSELGESMRSHGLLDADSPDADRSPSLGWYMDLRRYGSVPHGGFGLGIDRLVGYLAGIDNVKDVVPWPRYHGKCDG